MVKIKGKIVTEKAQFENYMTKLPYGNETLVIPDEEDTVDDILAAVQKAVNSVAPYARNCPIHHWHGRGCTYVTVQPIHGGTRDKFIRRINEIKSINAYIARDNDFDGRVQLLVCTPSPGDRPIEARNRFSDFEFAELDDTRGYHYKWYAHDALECIYLIENELTGKVK